MSDDVIFSACPGCEPERDPKGYVVYWCSQHEPDRAGELDRIVEGSMPYINGEGGAGGREWCEFIHRGRKS